MSDFDAAVARGFDSTPPEATIPALRAIIEDAIVNAPRSLQTTIGPSELGTSCDRCLIHKLAGTPERRDVAWLPFVGTAMHATLEDVVLRHEFASVAPRFLTEHRRMVGTVGGQEITGSTDVFDVASGTVVDYKLVGPTTITAARSQGATLLYQRQAQLYGKGWQDAGYQVRSVAIWFLPRNGVSLSAGYVWQAPYDRDVALATLAHADTLACAVNALGVDAVLSVAAPHTGAEFSCGRFPDRTSSTSDRSGHPTTSSLLALS